MIFLQFLWALLVFSSPGSTLGAMDVQQQNGNQVSQQLQSFNQAADQAGSKLHDLWSSYGVLPEFESQMEQPRERRNALNHMLTNFAQSPAEGSKDGRNWQAEADAWYQHKMRMREKGKQKQFEDELDNQKGQPRKRSNALDNMLNNCAPSPVEGSKDSRNWQAEADAWYESLQVQIAKRDANKKRTIVKQEPSWMDKLSKEEMRRYQADADAWYLDWMAHKAKKRSGGKRSPDQKENKRAVDQHEAVQSSETGKAKLKKASEEAKEEDVAFQDNVKLKQKPQTVGQQENQNRVKVKDKIDEQLQELLNSRNALSPAGGYESSPNYQTSAQAKSHKLDHEANYKLSKIEQEASEKLSKLPRAVSQDINNYEQKQRRSSGVCDPMEEVRLKTSSRLIAKGLGPLLPSESLEITRGRKLEEWQNNQMADPTYVKGKEYYRFKNLEPQNDNFDYSSAMDADLSQSFDYRMPQCDRLYSFDQRKRPNVLDYDRTKRKPKDLDIKSESSLGDSIHVALSKSGQDSSLKQAVGEPSQVNAKWARSPLEGEDYQRALQHNKAINKESKDMMQKLQQDSGLHGVALTKSVSKLQPSPVKESAEWKLKADSKAVAPTMNNQETRARRFPRGTRRVKRSLEKQQQHVAAKRRAQLLDDFKDHNRVSFGVLGNGLQTPQAKELGEGFLSLPGHEISVYNDPTTLIQLPKALYRHHEQQQAEYIGGLV
ncbi:interaptin-like isoform X2 [Drosophila kikkawai]|uniref:Interaptin-like isoform X2 n=1 Tax=Drosophila kikkawai TaxID=30033 RepID=A0A6P4HN56_DROKI|nr:uncharacterized protein LOC108070910 isoform X2 [Drosophila kikkawai]